VFSFLIYTKGQSSLSLGGFRIWLFEGMVGLVVSLDFYLHKLIGIGIFLKWQKKEVFCLFILIFIVENCHLRTRKKLKATVSLEWHKVLLEKQAAVISLSGGEQTVLL
jgi:hypothetical protein